MSVKKNICVLVALAAAAALSAETQAIELSDASTVIEETGIIPEKDAVPDFSLLLPLEPSSLPVLADSNISADTLIFSDVPESEEASGQDVFLEGSTGAGWPGFFSGDFSVYRNIGAEPFSVSFFHESVMGMGRHAAPDGFESQETVLSAEKRLAFGESVLLDVSGGYATRTDGLQGKNPGYFGISRQNVSGSAALTWNVRELLTLTGAADGIFNTQFMSSAAPASNTRRFFGMSTSAGLALDKGVWNAGVEMKYDFGTEQSRFEADAAFSVAVQDWAFVDLTAGTVFARQTSDGIIIPFAVTVRTGSDVSFSGSVSGGLKSSPVTPDVIQQSAPFIMADTTPAEVTEWFGEAVADIPFYGLGILNFSADFATTAQGEGRILPDYVSLDGTTGLMAVKRVKANVLDSSVGVTIPMKAVNASFGWNTSWLDSTRHDLTGCSSSALTAGVSFCDENGVWSAGADLSWAVDDMPEIGLNGSCQVSKGVRIALEAADIISLVSGKDRLICNTYAERGGYAALFVKVNF